MGDGCLLAAGAASHNLQIDKILPQTYIPSISETQENIYDIGVCRNDWMYFKWFLFFGFITHI